MFGTSEFHMFFLYDAFPALATKNTQQINSVRKTADKSCERVLSSVLLARKTAVFSLFWIASAGGKVQLTGWVKIRAIQHVPVRAVCLNGK
jgi:hypothetical protein